MKLVTILTLCLPFAEGFIGGRTATNKIANVVVNHQRPSFVTTTSSSSKLFLSDIPVPENEERDMREQDPINFLKLSVNSMDMNAFINVSIFIIISIAVLNTVATVDSEIMRGWTTEEMAVRIPVDNWLSYSSVLEASPVSTKAVTSATVYTIGDMISQGTEGKSIGEIDRPRVIRSLLAGLIGHGPLSHLWYNFSDNIFENVMHLQGWGGTAIKVAIDQTTWGPFWNNTYILLLGIMKWDKPANIFDEMKRTTIPLVVSGLKLWPLAHCVTYGLIPLENRLLWVDLVEIIWVTILSTAAAGADAGPDAEESEDAIVAKN